MRPKEVSDQDVIDAGKALEAEGRAVTGYALRQKLKTGSGVRLASVWKQYLDSKQQKHEASVSDLPVELADQLESLTKDLTERLGALALGMNDRAVKSAERRVTELVRTVEEKGQHAEREIADADLAVGELEASLEEARAAHQVALGELQTKDVELARLTERLASDAQEIERLRAQLQEVSLARERAEREAVAGKESTSTAREEAAELRGEVRSLQQQNELLLQKLGKAS